MKSMFQMILMLMILLLKTAVSGAFMNTQLSLIGFSDDGEYLAFEIYGFDTGKETGFSLIQIVDVVNNTFVIDDILEQNKTDLLKLSKNNLKKAGPFLIKYGIIKTNTGNLVFEDDAYNDHLTRFKSRHAIQIASFDYMNKNGKIEKYNLSLNTFKYKTKSCDHLKKVNILPKIFELLMTYKNQLMILQKDRRLYQSRQCPFEYGIYRVYHYKNKLAVFLHSWTAGHQGPNVHKLVVTGTLISDE